MTFDAVELPEKLFGLYLKEKDARVVCSNDSEKHELYFIKGRLVFASSDLIEHRLGEICYRYGFINLDQMTEAAAMVSREKKFGQVLITEKISSFDRLVRMLKLQLCNLLRYMFVEPTLKFEILEIKKPPFLQLQVDTPSLILSAQCFQDIYFENFYDLDENTLVSSCHSLEDFPDIFYRDIAHISNSQEISIEHLVSMTKLSNLNARLWILISQSMGFIEIPIPASKTATVLPRFAGMISEIEKSLQNFAADSLALLILNQFIQLNFPQHMDLLLFSTKGQLGWVSKRYLTKLQKKQGTSFQDIEKDLEAIYEFLEFFKKDYYEVRNHTKNWNLLSI